MWPNGYKFLLLRILLSKKVKILKSDREKFYISSQPWFAQVPARINCWMNHKHKMRSACLMPSFYENVKLSFTSNHKVYLIQDLNFSPMNNKLHVCWKMRKSNWIKNRWNIFITVTFESLKKSYMKYFSFNHTNLASSRELFWWCLRKLLLLVNWT